MSDNQSLRDKVKQKRLADLLSKHKEGKTTEREVKELDSLLAEREKQSEPVGWICSTEQLCQLFRVTRKTIAEWVKKGMPKIAIGTFDFQKVFPWWMDGIYQGLEDRDETITEAKRKYWVERARRETMRNDIQVGALLPCDKVYPAWSERAADLRQSLITLPPRMAPILSSRSEDEIRSKLREEVFTILTNFCRDGIYTPQKPPVVKRKPAVKPRKIKE